MDDKRQLLCSFSDTKSFRDVAKEIYKFYNVYNKRIFVFSNSNSDKELFLTYNIISDSSDISKFPNTISIHRKKEFNVLYTLNSLNALIEDETGKQDHHYAIDWSLYQNSLIITGDVGVRVIPIKIYDVLE